MNSPPKQIPTEEKHQELSSEKKQTKKKMMSLNSPSFTTNLRNEALNLESIEKLYYFLIYYI